MTTPAVTTAPSISLVCSKCGIMTKSGKLSCCGRGGSWFGNCGGAGKAELDYSWYEGIRACKDRQFQAAVVQQRNAPQPKSNVSSDDTSIGMKSKAAIAAAHIFAFAPTRQSSRQSSRQPSRLWRTMMVRPPPKQLSRESSESMLMPKSTIPDNNLSGSVEIIKSMHNVSATTSPRASVSTAITARECTKLLHVITWIKMVLMIVC